LGWLVLARKMKPISVGALAGHLTSQLGEGSALLTVNRALRSMTPA
jgi:hypothetical protein